MTVNGRRDLIRRLKVNRMFLKYLCCVGEVTSSSETVILLPLNDLVYFLSDIKSLLFDTPGILVFLFCNNFIVTWDVTMYHWVNFFLTF